MKMQSCFSQLLHELEMTSSSTVLLLDSTLKCILQHIVQGLTDLFIVPMSRFLTFVQCDKWRALGSEILCLQTTSAANTFHTVLPRCLKGLLYLVKKVIPYDRQVTLHIFTGQIFMLRLPKRLKSVVLAGRIFIIWDHAQQPKVSLAFRKISNMSCKQTWSFGWMTIRASIARYTHHFLI